MAERLEDRTVPALSIESIPAQNIELVGQPGAFTILTSGDDVSVAVNLDTNVFSWFGTDYSGPSSLYVSTNGVISLGTPFFGFNNTNLQNLSFPAISVLWDDWISTAGNPVLLGMFQDLTQDSIADQLIIQWNRVNKFGGGGQLTFHAILPLNGYGGNVLATLNYANLSFIGASSATVGFRSSTQVEYLVAFNEAANPYVQTGRGLQLITETVNQPPTANPDAFETNEDVPLVLAVAQLLANDTDPDPGDNLTVIAVSPTPDTHGTLTFDNGLITYTPDPDYFGIATFEYTIHDSHGASATALVTITVHAVNDPPEIDAPSAVQTDEDTSFTFSTANGNAIIIRDVDAGANAVEVVMTSPQGVLTLATISGLSFLAGTGTQDQVMIFTGTVANINAALDGLIFTPDPNFHGPADLMIEVNDLGHSGSGGPQTAGGVIDITVSPVNDAPVAEDDIYFVEKNGSLTIASPGVLANDWDVDGDALIVQVVSHPSNGNLVLNSDGSFTYVPRKGFGGTDSFTYLAFDGHLASNVATVAFVVAQKQPPTFKNLKYTRPTFSPDGKQILIAGFSNEEKEKVFLYDIATKKAREYELAGNIGFGDPTPVAFSSDGRLFAVGGSDRDGHVGRTAIWNVNVTKVPIRILNVSEEANQNIARSLAFSPDNRTIAVGYTSRVDIFEVASGRIRASLDVKAVLGGDEVRVDAISALAFNPAKPSQLVIAGPDQAKVVIWDIGAVTDATSTLNGPARIFTLAFSPDGKKLFAQGTTVQIYDFAGRTLLQELEVRTRPVGGVRIPIRSMAVSSDTKTILVGLADGSTKKVAVFEFDARRDEFPSNPTTIFTAAENGVVRFMSISNDGKHFTTSDEGLAIWLWELGRYRDEAPLRKIQS